MNIQKKIADSAVCCKNLKTTDIPFLYWKALEPLIGDRPIQMASQLLMKLQQIRAAGMDLGKIKKEFGQDLVLIGNVDTLVLCNSDLDEVRKEVTRCIDQAAKSGGYMFASCNSIFIGMNATSVFEMYRYAQEIGSY